MTHILYFVFGYVLSRLWVPGLKQSSKPALTAPGYHFIGKPIEREHTDGVDCWCHPTLFFDGGDQYGNVWVHKGNGEELPPAKVLIEAVADAMRYG